MIYVFYGTDGILARQKMHALIDALLKKKPDTVYTRVTEEVWNDSTLPESVGSQGLFSEKMIVLFDHLLETDAGDAILDSLDEIAASQNIFVFVEAALDKKTLVRLEKNAEKIQECNQKENVVTRGNLFGLADAFGRRDKKLLWVEFQMAKRQGARSEEVHGIIFWKLKSMLLVGSSRYFTKEELVSLSRALVCIYHDAHRGLVDFDNMLERFVLGV